MIDFDKIKKIELIKEMDKIIFKIKIKNEKIKNKNHPNTRSRTKDRPITTFLLQSGALPTELCSDK